MPLQSQPVFFYISDKEDDTQGSLWFLDDPGTEELKAASTSSVYITPTLLGMINDGADPQFTILPKILPLKIGEKVPFGHNLKDSLPKCTSYPTSFVAWFKYLHWAFIKNNKQSITNKDGDIFNAFN